MRHEHCDWAIAGECDFCGHRTSPSNLLVCHGHEFCDEECKAGWEREHKAAANPPSRGTWRFVYAECLDKADDMRTECITGISPEKAKDLFAEKVRGLMSKALSNELLAVSASIHKWRALFTFESRRHMVVAEEVR